MVHLRYPRENRDGLRELFEARGITGHGEGITLKDAWVSKSRHAFALVHVENEAEFQRMCSVWAQFGDLNYTRVIDIDEIM
jgi:hypothetical protein